MTHDLYLWVAANGLDGSFYHDPYGDNSLHRQRFEGIRNSAGASGVGDAVMVMVLHIGKQ